MQNSNYVRNVDCLICISLQKLHVTNQAIGMLFTRLEHSFFFLTNIVKYHFQNIQKCKCSLEKKNMGEIP